MSILRLFLLSSRVMTELLADRPGHAVGFLTYL